MCKPMPVLMLIMAATLNTIAAPIDYTGCDVIKLEHTKDAWLSSYPVNRTAISMPGILPFHANSHVLVDFDVSSLPAFSEIAGVQLVFKEDEPWTAFSGFLTTASGRTMTGTRPRSATGNSPRQPLPAIQAIPGRRHPMSHGKQVFRILLCHTNRRRVADIRRTELVRNRDSVYNIFIDLDKTILKDLLEGNCHGLCLWAAPRIYIFGECFNYGYIQAIV